ncbi:MAG: hypothetical protein K2Z81_25260 [Cyanobacteria bacterium]|nr:hypothetical protein [Cyanobacteriota bacterium]
MRKTTAIALVSALIAFMGCVTPALAAKPVKLAHNVTKKCSHCHKLQRNMERKGHKNSKVTKAAVAK